MYRYSKVFGHTCSKVYVFITFIKLFIESLYERVCIGQESLYESKKT